MKVSLNLIKQFTDIPVGINQLMEKIEAQLAAVEAVTNLAGRHRGIVVAKVVESVAHPNAERLHVCMIDDGGKTEGVERDASGLVQIVCGAANVRVGMLAVWLPPGTTVPDSIGADPFVIEIRDIRGQKSNGMLGSAKELALGDNHEGILEITGEAKPGDQLETVYELNDYIIDLENKMFTHRPDCFGQLGIAREVAGILGQRFDSPSWYKQPLQIELQPSGEQLPLELSNELPELVPRFMAVALGGTTMKPGSSLLQTYLARLGIRPINIVVDITNYMMLLSGQPMHAYDYDKVKALSGGNQAKLVVRYPKPGEKLTLIGGKVIEPRAEAIMIATDKQLIGLGGVMGGADTEVDANTTRVILECATFDMYSVRRTAMALGLFTDAVTRFTKGQSPLQNDRVLNETLRLLGKHTGAKLASAIIDDNHVGQRLWVHPPVPVTASFINSRLGLQLGAVEMKQLLENVECKVDIENDKLTVTAPFWRTDIETREDVVEEIGRLYGYDKLPHQLPQRNLTPAAKDPLLELKAQVRLLLSECGANELLTYSFTHGNLLDKAGQDRKQAYQLANALSPDLQYYRVSLTPSLLEKIYPNVKAGYEEFALFEIGKVHVKDMSNELEPHIPGELNRLALVTARSGKSNKGTHHGAAYYEAKKYLSDLLDGLGITEIRYLPYKEPSSEEDKQAVRPFEPSRSSYIQVGNAVLGILGEYKSAVRQSLKLSAACAGFELDMDVLLPLVSSNTKSHYLSLSRYPRVEQDISLKLPVQTTYQQVYDCIWEYLNSAKPDRSIVALVPVDIYQREDDLEHKQITFRLSIASYDRTLTDSEVNSLLDSTAAAANTKLQAERL
jgi:phenylalanyl-tRNA synthetase beta chain